MRRPLEASGSEDVSWQRLWFGLWARRCRSLAIVGIDPATIALDVARHLEMVGSSQESSPIAVISALGMEIHDTRAVARNLRMAPDSPLTLVACGSPDRHPATLPIVQAVDGVVLVVRLGSSRLESIRRTVDTVGRDRVMATVSIG